MDISLSKAVMNCQKNLSFDFMQPAVGGEGSCERGKKLWLSQMSSSSNYSSSLSLMLGSSLVVAVL